MSAYAERLTNHFFISLVCVEDDEAEIRSHFVAAFLSVDHLQHPLLHGCQCVPAPVDGVVGTYAFDLSDFIRFRLDLLDRECTVTLRMSARCSC